MDETTLCGVTFSKQSIERITYGIAGLIIGAICSVLFITSFLLPLINFSDYKSATCNFNTSSINVKCLDAWDANCHLVVDVTRSTDDVIRNRIARFPVTEGANRLRVEAVADQLMRTGYAYRCYYSQREGTLVAIQDPMPGTYVLILFGAAGLIAIGAIIFGVIFLIKGFCTPSNYATVTVEKTQATDPKYGGPTNPVGATTTLYDNRSRASRNVFVGRVYGILTVQLFLTFGTIAVTVIVPPVRGFAQANWWLMLVGLGISLVLLIPLIILRKSTPFNFILLLIFTLGFAVEIAVVCTYFGATIVFQASITCIVIFLALTIFCIQTKIDFTILGGGLFTCLWGMIAFGFLCWIFPVSGFTMVIYGYCGVILFSLFILYDTTLLLEKYDDSEYILAAVNLYLDIMNLFLYLLRIFGAGKK